MNQSPDSSRGNYKLKTRIFLSRRLQQESHPKYRRYSN